MATMMAFFFLVPWVLLAVALIVRAWLFLKHIDCLFNEQA